MPGLLYARRSTSFIAELKRRNVFKVWVACLVAAWLIVQRTEILIPMLLLPEWIGCFILLLLAVLSLPTLIDSGVIRKIMSMIG